MEQTKYERQNKKIKEFQERISALQRKGYTIYRVSKGGYDGEHWGWKHKDGTSDGGFSYQSSVVDHLEKITK